MPPLPDDDPRPPYLQIADALRTSIRGGQFVPGAQIPTIDDLALQFGVARNTVRSALRELTDEGLLMPRHGKGVFVRSSLPEAADPVADSSRLDALYRELTEVRDEVRDLRQRLAALEARAGQPAQGS